MNDLFNQASLTKNSEIVSESSSWGFDFSRVIGQDKVKSILTRIIQKNRLSNAYLFFGPEGVGKDSMAVEFAKALNCKAAGRKPCHECDSCRQIGARTHPDFRFVFSAPKDLKEADHIQHVKRLAENPYLSSAYSATAEILIDKIRELKKAASLRLYNAKAKVFVLSEAERMRNEAANSLLKLLEEPPENLTLILSTARMDKMLPTVVSRCQIVKFSPLARQEIKGKLINDGIVEEQAEVFSRLSMGNYRKAQELSQDDYNTMRDQALKLLMIATSKNNVDRMATIAEISQGKSRGEIKELFFSVLTWLRDLQIISSDPHNLSQNDILFNADQTEKLTHLQKSFSAVDLHQAAANTENYMDLIDKNVYISLIFINYLNDLAVLHKSTNGTAKQTT